MPSIETIVIRNQKYTNNLIFILKSHNLSYISDNTQLEGNENDILLGKYYASSVNISDDSADEETYNRRYNSLKNRNMLYTHTFINNGEYKNFNHNKPSLKDIISKNDEITANCLNFLEGCSDELLCIQNGTCFDYMNDGSPELGSENAIATVTAARNYARESYFTLTVEGPQVTERCLTGNCAISGGKKRKSKRRKSKQNKRKSNKL